jgi:heptosyltransferase-3
LATSTLPSAFGNPGPPFRTLITVADGPRRLTDDGERPRFHVARGPGSLRRRGRVKLAACSNILVLTLDFIGDWVLTTPFLENLRGNAPRARITVVVLERVFDLAAACPFVDRVVALSSARGRRICVAAASVSDLAGFRRDYVGQAFDLALVPRWDVDFNGALQIAHGSGAPRILGFSERCTPRRRELNRGDDRFYSEAILDRRVVHEVEHKLAFLTAIGGTVASRRVSVAFSDADAARADGFLREAFGKDRRPLLAVAPFVADGRRMLPADRLAGLVLRLRKHFELDVVVIGGPSDGPKAQALAKSLGPRAACAAGKLRLRESAAILARSAALIGMDSGPAHIAAAVETPVAVFSSHPMNGSPDHPSSPVRFAPWGDPARILVLQPPAGAPPCADGCETDEAHSILGLTEERVWPALSRFVGAALAASKSQPGGAKRSR